MTTDNEDTKSAEDSIKELLIFLKNNAPPEAISEAIQRSVISRLDIMLRVYAEIDCATECIAGMITYIARELGGQDDEEVRESGLSYFNQCYAIAREAQRRRAAEKS